jgi:protein TonB
MTLALYGAAQHSGMESGGKVMSYARQQRNPTKHFAGIGFVIVFHILLVYGLLTGLARQVVDVIKQPLETKIIEEIKPPPPPDRPPPPPPKLAVPPPAFIPPPEIQIAQAPPPQTTITAVTSAPPPPQVVAKAPEAAPPRESVRVAPVIDAKRSCAQPEYPAASKRLEESGTVLLKFVIDVDGKVVESDVETSSGHPRLDDAAREALSRCRFKPGTVDGKPERSVARLKYTWKLN